ncbi:TonB-dependent siderophore receptor [uncultured Massilia sp.]|uniref:TonB-dependent siderophore receptor n=1 Tax=uncultured Massilia sp. TaxID=169973 RepID=UPI0025D4FC26|nr:TonB-dependent siderophore receptor [uncultured Massilia sp.]
MNKHAHACRRLNLDRLALLVSLAAPLAAQAAGPDEAPDAPGPVQQVRVSGVKDGAGAYLAGKDSTAVPLDLTLRETPQSVTIVTRQRMDDQLMMSVTDVVNNATGVSVNQYETNRAGFTARGFDIDNLQIDGIPTTWEQQWSGGEVASSLAIYDRVDVVRGATGLMTGAGNPSAAINLVRKRATSKTLAATVEAGIGRWNERRVMGDVSSPLNTSGSVRLRVVGEHTGGDTWVDLAKKESNTLYATVDADLGRATTLSAGFGRQENRQDSPMWGGLPYWYTDGGKIDWDVSKTTSASWSRWPTTYDNGFVNLEHAFDNGWTVRANYSHGDRKSDSYLLYLSGVPDRATGLGMNAFSGSYLTRTKKEDVGLYASGPFDLFGRRHEAAFGYMHMKQDFTSDSRAADYGSQDPSVGDFNHWNGAAYPTPAWGPLSFYEEGTTKQEALYGVARFALADPLKLIVGARVTDYEKTGHGLYTAAYSIRHDSEVTPYAGLIWDIDRTFSAYASYTDIFQPQNYKDLAGNILEPIVGKNYEAGVKGEFLDGRLHGAFAVFRIEQDKLAQAAGTVDRDGAGPLIPEAYYRAASGARSEGVEFELTGELARGWNASAGYTQFRAKDADGVDLNSVYPRRLLRVFTTYRLPDAWSRLTVGGGVNWEGRTYTVDPNAPGGTSGLIEQEAFGLVNLMARYEFDKQLSAQLNIDNAFDKKHFGMFAAYGALTYAAPRRAALTLRYRF